MGTKNIKINRVDLIINREIMEILYYLFFRSPHVYVPVFAIFSWVFMPSSFSDFFEGMYLSAALKIIPALYLNITGVILIYKKIKDKKANHENDAGNA